MTVTANAFRHAMGQFATGVAVVTWETGDAVLGLTVNSLTAVSLDPPLVLYCVKRAATVHEACLQAPRFVINVLKAGQEGLAKLFALRGPQSVSPNNLAQAADGARLVDSLVALYCTQYQTMAGGDHSIIVGQVVQVELGSGQPLIFYGSQFLQTEAGMRGIDGC